MAPTSGPVGTLVTLTGTYFSGMPPTISSFSPSFAIRPQGATWNPLGLVVAYASLWASEFYEKTVARIRIP